MLRNLWAECPRHQKASLSCDPECKYAGGTRPTGWTYSSPVVLSHKSDMRSISKVWGSNQIWVNGAFHFVSLCICLNQSCCWRLGSVSMWLANTNLAKIVSVNRVGWRVGLHVSSSESFIHSHKLVFPLQWKSHTKEWKWRRPSPWPLSLNPIPMYTSFGCKKARRCHVLQNFLWDLQIYCLSHTCFY